MSDERYFSFLTGFALNCFFLVLKGMSSLPLADPFLTEFRKQHLSLREKNNTEMRLQKCFLTLFGIFFWPSADFAFLVSPEG